MIDEKQKAQILSGREAIDKYREEHVKLYTTVGISNIPEAHTPLINKAKSVMIANEIESLDKLFELSFLLNLQELGFETIEDFDKKYTIDDIKKLNEIWH